MKRKPVLIRMVEAIKSKTGCRTHHIENVLTFAALLVVALVTKGGWVEYLGVFAVYFTFNHASIAERLREVEAVRQSSQSEAQFKVRCYKKLSKYFYAKEVTWLIYFIELHAWSALVGVGIFLLYQPWRNYWRKHNPITYPA